MDLRLTLSSSLPLTSAAERYRHDHLVEDDGEERLKAIVKLRKRLKRNNHLNQFSLLNGLVGSRLNFIPPQTSR